MNSKFEFKNQKSNILPIIGYGDPVLRKVGEEISADYLILPKSSTICMKQCTMLMVLITAPQIGLAIRLFVITEPLAIAKI